MEGVRIALMGPASVTTPDGLVHVVAGARKRALLSALVLHRRAVVTADVLIDAVWGEEPPTTASSALRVHLSELRKLLADLAPDLGDAIVTADSGYRLTTTERRLDVGRFELLADAAADVADTEAMSLLIEALAVWNGTPYVDLLDHEPGANERARLQRRRREAAGRLAALAQRLRSVDAIPALVREHDVTPDDEAVAAALATLLHTDGRRGEALATVRRTREHLENELGAAPGFGLLNVEEAILSGETTASPRWWSRPHRPTPLLGRADATSRVDKLMATAGPVTIVGPPGVGKTRLAEHCAGQLGASYDGVAWVDAGSIGNDADLLALVASTFAVPDHPFRPVTATVSDRLIDADPLLVVDNAEHVVDGVVELVDALADTGTSIIITSRVPLEHPAERIVRLGPLPDDAGCELLLDAVDRAGGTTELSESVSWAAEVCDAVDGLPLAIELAAKAIAAHGADLDPETVVRRLVARDSARGGSLGEAVAMSLALIGPGDVDVFDRCGRFASWFGPDDASALVDGDAEAALIRLSAHSLVATGHGNGGERYRLIGPLREIARRRLDGDAQRRTQTDERLARHVASEVADASRRFRSGNADQARRRLGEVDPDLPAALEWFEAGADPDGHVQLVADLWFHWYLVGRFAAGRRRTETALETGAGTAAARGDALAAASFLAWVQGDYPAARRWVSAARDLGASGTALPVVDLANATLAWIDHDLDEAERCLASAMADLHRANTSGPERAFVGSMWANVAWFRGEQAQAAMRYRRAALDAERIGHSSATSLARRHEVLCLALAADPTALPRVEHLLDGRDDELDPIARCQTSTLAGLALLELGRLDRATELLTVGVQDAARLVDAISLLLGTVGLVRIAHRREHADGVAAGLGWIDTALGLTGVPLPRVDRAHLDAADLWLAERSDDELTRRRVECAALPADQLAAEIAPPR